MFSIYIHVNENCSFILILFCFRSIFHFQAMIFRWFLLHTSVHRNSFQRIFHFYSYSAYFHSISSTFEMILVRKTLSVFLFSQSVCLLRTVKAISIRCEDLFVVWYAIHVYFCHLMTYFPR